MFKTVLLSPNSLKQFNRFVVVFTPLLGPFIFAGLALRYATFLVSAPAGRILSVISAIAQVPGIVVTLGHMRTEYVKVIVPTFDFCFLQIANTLWAITMSLVLRDLRITVVFVCWVNFTCWLLQETYLRNSNLVVGVALWEWLFFVMLLLLLSLDLVDEVEHYSLVTTRDRTISTKDVLANVIGTMAMLSLRNLCRRVWYAKYRTSKPGAAIPALGYRCKIALSSVSTTLNCNVLPRRVSKSSEESNASSTSVKLNKIPPLQMQLRAAAESAQFDAEKTVWPRIGALTPISPWKLVVVYAFDGLTPIMKRRLRFKYWMATSGIGVLWVVHILLLLDVMMFGIWGLRDRVFMNFSFLGRRSTFHVVPFLLSRIVTIFVWSGRYAYVVITRQNDNALILLRGEVEFDYEGWKERLRIDTRKK
ncbi:hypothetical protein KRP22_007081 [Phytophthora ramorum]|nr:hypothetical protein KRP22_1822 [Phytophthora ramorum]